MKHLRILFFSVLAVLATSIPLQANALPSNVIFIKPSELVSKIENSPQPFALLIFTSWCPYCKKQLELLNALSVEERKKMPEIYAVSVDADPTAYSNYIAKMQNPYFSTRLYSGTISLESLLQNYASKFDGGIPYTAIFQNKKIAKELNGLAKASEFSVSQ